LRICLAYDHLFPETIGGTERWMRDLATSLAASGHSVTYLTMRHWQRGSVPELPGVRIVGLVAPGRMRSDDRRTVAPPLRFGLAVGAHLGRRAGDYDVFHTAAFPYFPLLGAAVARRRGGFRVFADWHEVWTRDYWRRYAGTLVGSAGWAVQRACVRTRHRAFCVSRLHADRLVSEGFRGTPVILPGMYAGPITPSAADAVDPHLIVYAGRHVPEKRVDLLVEAFAAARRRRPELRLELYGDGPTRSSTAALAERLQLGDSVTLAGPRAEEEVGAALGRAACLATASEREGYGLVVVEAAARGTPSVVVAGPENAAIELLQEDVNGAVAPRASAEALAEALLRVVGAGLPLRAATARWFADNAPRLTLERSLDVVLAAYEDAAVAG
jgi:glycosyltransferase involved in cell wall biosynthesis